MLGLNDILFNSMVSWILATVSCTLAVYGGRLLVQVYRRRDGDLIGWIFGVGAMFVYLALKWI
jgi:hypothetical protein